MDDEPDLRKALRKSSSARATPSTRSGRVRTPSRAAPPAGTTWSSSTSRCRGWTAWRCAGRCARATLLAERRERRLERAVNDETLRRLRTAGLVGLGGLLVLSLAIGYGVAGRVLSPVRRIAVRARELGGDPPDMSGRIALGGPNDELRDLADTLDGLLERTEEAVTASGASWPTPPTSSARRSPPPRRRWTWCRTTPTPVSRSIGAPRWSSSVSSDAWAA